MWWLCVCLDVKGFQLFDMPAAVSPECRNSAVQHLAEGVRALAGNARTHAACAARAVHMAGLIRAACWRCLPTCRQTPALQVEFGIDSSRDALASFRANTSHSAAAPFNAVTGRPPADLPPLKVRVRLMLAAQLHLSAADGCRVIAMLWFRMATDCNLSNVLSICSCLTCICLRCAGCCCPLPGGAGGGAGPQRAAGAACCGLAAPQPALPECVAEEVTGAACVLRS